MSSVLALLVATAVQSTGTLVPNSDSSSSVASLGLLRTVEGPMEVKPSDAALANARGMMACAVKKKPVEAAQVLSAIDLTGIATVVRRLMPTLQTCMGKAAEREAGSVELGLSTNMLRALMAEAWMRQKGLPSLAPVAYIHTAPGSDWLSGNLGQKIVLRMADCLAAKEPYRSEAMLYATPGSPEERAAFSALTPVFSSCLEKNVTLTTNRVGVRLALASAIDRRSRQPAPAIGTK